MADLEQYEDFATLVARLFMGALFVLYGYFKLTGYAGTVAYMGRQGLPAPALFAALAVIIELGGGLLILFGYLWPILPISGGAQMNLPHGYDVRFIGSVLLH